MVLRHFWAVVHTIKTGPLRAAEDGKSISVGPLAGLFLGSSPLTPASSHFHSAHLCFEFFP